MRKSCLIKRVFLVLTMSLNVLVVMAQMDTCITNLKNAGTEYDNGNYDQAITLLNNTLKRCPLSKQDQLQVSKLLILCYLSIDDLEAADNTAAAIMKIDPNFTTDKFKDDPRLSSLFAKYKPEPKLAVAISGGANWPVIDVVQSYSIVHADDAEGLDSYSSKPGYQFHAAVEKRVFKSLWAEVDFQFRSTNYHHTLDSVQNSTIHYSENLTSFDFPVSVKYYFLQGTIKPYLEAGIDFSFLSRALSTTSLDDQTDLVDRTAFRNKTSIGYFGGAGLRYSTKAFGVFGNIRYILFPDLVNKEGTRYADDINLYKYYYVDDDFKMNNLQFNIGISYILSYKISKVK